MKVENLSKKLKITFLVMVCIFPIFELGNIVPASARICADPPTCTLIYSVTFTESGLPTGTQWSIIFNGNSFSSTSSSITEYDTSGTYSYTINPVNGYISNPKTGTITLNYNMKVDITFTFAQGSLSKDSEFTSEVQQNCASSGLWLTRSSIQDGGAYLYPISDFATCTIWYSSDDFTFGSSGYFNVVYTLSYYGTLQSINEDIPAFGFHFMMFSVNNDGSLSGFADVNNVYEFQTSGQLQGSQQGTFQSTWTVATSYLVSSSSSKFSIGIYQWYYGGPSDVVDFYNSNYNVGNVMISWMYTGQ